MITLQAPGNLATAREQLYAHRLEKLPLVDDQGRLRGLITAQDIIKLELHPQATKDAKGRLRVGAAVGARPRTSSVPRPACRRAPTCSWSTSPMGTRRTAWAWCGG